MVSNTVWILLIHFISVIGLSVIISRILKKHEKTCLQLSKLEGIFFILEQLNERVKYQKESNILSEYGLAQTIKLLKRIQTQMDTVEGYVHEQQNLQSNLCEMNSSVDNFIREYNTQINNPNYNIKALEQRYRLEFLSKGISSSFSLNPSITSCYYLLTLKNDEELVESYYLVPSYDCNNLKYFKEVYQMVDEEGNPIYDAARIEKMLVLTKLYKQAPDSVEFLLHTKGKMTCKRSKNL